MNPLWFMTAVMSVFGGIADYGAGKDMEALAKEQKLMADENAMLEQRELDEATRRQEIKDAQVRGSAQAKAAASGRLIEGSLSDYLGFIESEQGRELEWMKNAGASRIRLNKQAGYNQANALKAQGKAKKLGLVTGLLGGVSAMGQAGLFSSGGTWSVSESSFYSADLL